VTDAAGLPREHTVKNFPWRRRGVLLPAGDRRTAALGICMFTASKPKVLAAQAASFWLVRLAGSRVLPGRKQRWTAPFPSDVWPALLADWRSGLGAFDAMAVYQRRQAERDGLTLLLTRSGAGIAVVKVRSEGASLKREQVALDAVAAVRPGSFRAPVALGSGSIGSDLHWSAQSSVFERPHRPVLEAPTRLFDDVRDCLERIPEREGPLPAPAHNDLTPWNLRRDHRGGVWLYDWEDWGAAPEASDRVYFHATASALTGAPMPIGLPRPAIEQWRAVILARQSNTRADIALNAGILSALDQAADDSVEM
jgi:hypothetical protein